MLLRVIKIPSRSERIFLDFCDFTDSDSDSPIQQQLLNIIKIWIQCVMSSVDTFPFKFISNCLKESEGQQYCERRVILSIFLAATQKRQENLLRVKRKQRRGRAHRTLDVRSRMKERSIVEESRGCVMLVGERDLALCLTQWKNNSRNASWKRDAALTSLLAHGNAN